MGSKGVGLYGNRFEDGTHSTAARDVRFSVRPHTIPILVPITTGRSAKEPAVADTGALDFGSSIFLLCSLLSFH